MRLAISYSSRAAAFFINRTINVTIDPLLTFYALNMYEDMDTQRRAFQSLALDGGELSD
jgi:hypothetical protein